MPIIKEHMYTYWVVIITKDITSCLEDKLTTYPTQITQFKCKLIGQLNGQEKECRQQHNANA